VRRKILEYCEFHLSRSCKNSTDKKETLRRMAKPMEFVQETYKQQRTDTFSFRMRIEKDTKATSIHEQNHYTVSNFGRVASVMASASYYRQQQFGQVYIKSNGYLGCQLGAMFLIIHCFRTLSEVRYSDIV
jgi:hypothetical protein